MKTYKKFTQDIEENVLTKSYDSIKDTASKVTSRIPKPIKRNLGRFARNRYKGITILITRSSGKTSTNYFLSNALNQFGKTHKTFGNNNNIIGLSLTLSRLPHNFNFCVFETTVDFPCWWYVCTACIGKNTRN